MRSGSDSGNYESKEQMSPPERVGDNQNLDLDSLQHGRTYSETLQSLVSSGNYKAVEFALEAKLDQIDGIKTTIVHSSEFPTGVAKVRDSSMAIPFAGRMPANASERQVNSMLMRALGSTRGIDHVLGFESKNPGDMFAAEKNNLQKAYGELVEEATRFLSSPQTATLEPKEVTQRISLLHKKFNTDLANILISTGLAEGMTEANSFEALITHYRDLSSVLEPAKSMRTIFTDHRGDKIIIHTETAHPVTAKTPLQIEQLKVMQTIGGEKKDFHSKQPVPVQMANRAFHDLIAQDNTRLPAQTRKSIAPTVKNGYQVDYTIQVKGEEQKYSMSSLRCGSMAYVGKGRIADYSKAKDGDPYTRENMAQLDAYANKNRKADEPHIPLHVGMLLTESSSSVLNMEHQNEIIEATRGELKHANIKGDFSLTSINWLGRRGGIQVKDDLLAKVKNYAQQNNITFPSTATDSRLEDAALIALVVSKDPARMHVTTCASGQDRTGTVDEFKAQLFAKDIYKNVLKIDVTREEIAEKRGEAGHMPALASHAVTGSRGMKFDSEPKEAFPKEMTKHYYTKIADTNKAKSMKVDEKVLLNTLAAAGKFKECMDMIKKENSTPETIHGKLVEWAKMIEKPKNNSGNKLASTNMFVHPISMGEKIAQQCIHNIVISKTLEEALKSAPADFITKMDTIHASSAKANDKYQPALSAAARLISAATEKFPQPGSPSPAAGK